MYVAAVFVALATLSAQRTEELTITPLGHSAVHMTDGTHAIVVDFPYETGQDFAPWDADMVPSGPKPLCIVTHAHRDHFAAESADRPATRRALSHWLEFEVSTLRF